MFAGVLCVLHGEGTSLDLEIFIHQVDKKLVLRPETSLNCS